jgi:catechol 2,3-dioxygenase-like lactoylglutathione lyase family enzyme
MRGRIDHIVLTVREPQASFALYDAFLRFLGYELVSQGDAGFEWALEGEEGEEGSPSICLVKARDGGTARQHDRYSPGLHHLAWAADSREDVDRLHALLVERRADVLDAPADYPQYNKGQGYYAVFFADGDGLKLEYVFTPR